MKFLTYDETVKLGLRSHAERCGSSDVVVFFADDDNTYYMLCENEYLNYIGLTIIKDDEEVADVFMQREDDFDGMKEHFGFNWEMMFVEKIKVLENYCY